MKWEFYQQKCVVSAVQETQMKKVIRVVSRDLSNNSVCGFHAMDPPKMHGNNLNSGKLLEIETC